MRLRLALLASTTHFKIKADTIFAEWVVIGPDDNVIASTPYIRGISANEYCDLLERAYMLGVERTVSQSDTASTNIE